LVTETKGVAALRSVADMLRKSIKDSIKSIAIYRRDLDKLQLGLHPGALKKQLYLVVYTSLYSHTKCAL
jgi:hypothetical protein